MNKGFFYCKMLFQKHWEVLDKTLNFNGIFNRVLDSI